MVSLIERIDSMGKAVEMKSSHRFWGTFGSALGSYLLGSAAESLPDSRTSYALLYLLQPDVRFCVDLYVRVMTRLTWQLISNHTHDPKNDQIIAESTDVKSRHVLFDAFRRHTKRYGLSPIAAITYQYLLYDEVYVQKIRNKHGHVTDIRVLNTLAMDPVIERGRIVAYQYHGLDDPQRLEKYEIAYGHGFNPLNDLGGGSLVESVLKSANVLRNLMTYIDSLFINNGRPGLIASFKQEVTDERVLRLFEKQLEAHHKGSRQAFRTFIANLPMDWQPMDDPDVQRQFAVEEPITKQIYRAFGVPMVMAGDTSATDYKESEEIYAAFVKSQVVPHTDSVAQFLNDELVPVFGDLRIKPDVSEFRQLTEGDKRQSEIISTHLQNTLISIGKAQEASGYDPDPDLKDLYYVEGIPVPKAALRDLWKTKYGSESAVLSSLLQGRSHRSHDHVETPTRETWHKEPEPWDYTPQKAFKELVYWQKWTLNPDSFKHTGDQFVPVYLRGDYADIILEGGQSKEAFDKVFAALKRSVDTIEGEWTDIITALALGDSESAVRTITGIKLDFASRFSAVIEEIRAGTLDRSRAGRIVRQLLRVFGARAFRQGLADGGVLADPDEGDETEMGLILKEQSQYVSGLTKTITTKGISGDEARLKAGQWFGKSVLPFYHAGVKSANGNAMMEFTGMDGIKPCPECSRLKTQRHRMKDWERKQLRPQVDGHNFGCEGFNCEHTLVPIVGKARGGW